MRLRFRPAGLLLACGAAATLVTSCGTGSHRSATPPVPTTPVTAAVTTRPPATAPPTTVWTPKSTWATPDGAAAALVGAWSTGDRAAALRVARPDAVSALFASPYPAGYLQPRGCTDGSAQPATCTYRNTETNGIYEIGSVKDAQGWYVVTVTAES